MSALGMLLFLYQLQGIEKLVVSPLPEPPTLIVVDYSKDGSREKRLSRDEVQHLKQGGKNRVLAYFSIGEAEEARWYWKKLPKRVRLAANPQWPDNYPVKYWTKEWHAVMQDYLGQILEQGFDGVYLDTVDTFYRFPERKTAAAEMVTLIREISDRARKLKPDFVVVQQNASCLPEATTKLDEYWKAIDGIGVESTFFFGDKWEDNDFAPQEQVLKCLGAYRDKKKFIVGIEYVRSPEKKKKAKEAFAQYGILGVITDRKLKGEFFD